MILPNNIFKYLLCGTLLASTISVASSSSFDTLAAREEAKPFYLRDIQIGDTTLPFSPASVVIVILSVIMLLRNFLGGPKSSAVASHILVDDTEEAKAKLTALKKEINDFTKFKGAAQRYSKCPSGKTGGSLGSFSPGMMVPAFDKVIFDRESKVGQVIGPIRTNFGYHLIWIEERNLVE
mmetsp:Transcript_9430/g.15619  ORF Transcript_9430/g.15619 Transcript_9430/m.15619 type:complete len:180 (+) Transcript_9430:171-710(+)